MWLLHLEIEVFKFFVFFLVPDVLQYYIVALSVVVVAKQNNCGVPSSDIKCLAGGARRAQTPQAAEH